MRRPTGACRGRSADRGASRFRRSRPSGRTTAPWRSRLGNALIYRAATVRERSTGTQLESDAGAELHHPGRVALGCDAAEVGRVNAGGRGSEVHQVEYVERIRLEDQPQALPDEKLTPQAHVLIVGGRVEQTEHHRPGRVAVGVSSGGGKRIPVEERRRVGSEQIARAV